MLAVYLCHQSEFGFDRNLFFKLGIVNKKDYKKYTPLQRKFILICNSLTVGEKSFIKLRWLVLTLFLNRRTYKEYITEIKPIIHLFIENKENYTANFYAIINQALRYKRKIIFIENEKIREDIKKEILNYLETKMQKRTLKSILKRLHPNLKRLDNIFQFDLFNNISNNYRNILRCKMDILLTMKK
jgi:hypothetical protein